MSLTKYFLNYLSVLSIIPFCLVILNGCIATMGMEEIKVTGDLKFVVTSVDNRSNPNAKNLYPGDAVLMASGLSALGMDGDINYTVLGGQFEDYLASRKYELLYHTGHGSSEGITFNDVYLTPSGFCTGYNECEWTSNVEIGVRYVFFATCQSASRDWCNTFTDRTEALFGYTCNTLDIADNEVVVNLLRCFEEKLTTQPEPMSTRDYLDCWIEANEAVDAYDEEAGVYPFIECWKAFVRESDGHCEPYHPGHRP